MVTSNKMPDKKVVKMADQSNSVVVPQRTLLGEVNEHITCPLCRGYYIDATTIVECLHSFCRSCIIKHLQVKSYCPVCEMMINSARPNIKLDKALQDIVYKLVPGLFQKEMERRQQFYASRPGPAASATPEQRGEDTERIIFSPEDVISFSLEYADVTDSDSISSKSSDSNDPQPVSATTRRYLQCPAVVNISHLKKFLCMKFDIDSSQFAIDILYKRVPLPDYYTLMDIAYIYNWKRNEPMRFFYQITDYIAIRNRFFDINRKSSHFRDSKSSPTPTEDTNVSSPAQNLNDHCSEVSSGTDSPMPDDNNVKKTNDTLKKNEKAVQRSKDNNNQDSTDDNKKATPTQSKKSDDDVEKSQFLNSFELTAKNNCTPMKTSPVKPNVNDKVTLSNDSTSKSQTNIPKTEDSLKRKHHTVPNMPEMKKLKIELEKTKLTNILNNSTHVDSLSTTNQNGKSIDSPPTKSRDNEGLTKSSQTLATTNSASTLSSTAVKELKQQQTTMIKQQVTETPGLKRNVPVSQNMASPKRKPVNDTLNSMQPPVSTQRTVSPLKLQVPKSDAQFPSSKATDLQKPAVKKMPDLKPSIPSSQASQNKVQQINKVRMDLLANNSDPTIDRSKILSQVKSSLSVQSGTTQTSGDPLKSLFDSCKINIPSSLSITLTDQKLDPRNSGEATNVEQKKNMVNKNLTAASSAVTHKVPSPPVHNYIEILKLPDNDPKKQNKTENNSDIKVNPPLNKTETTTSQQKPPSKSSETSTKGPIPNLKPIADTKLGKQNTNFSAPITFQQTFEQQVQSMQSDKKSKLPKNKTQVPKLVPATPKAFSTCKFNNNSNKPTPTNTLTTENKTSIALDLSTPHNIQSQLGPQQTKAFETMQSIANLAKKQNLTSKGLPLTMSQNNVFSSISNRPLITGVSPLRVPTASSINQMKLDKTNSNGSQINNLRSEMPNKASQMKPMHNAATTLSSPGYQITSHNSPCATQPSPRSQTRSPSSSPKLVIAEEKQAGTSTEQNINQSNQITSTQIPNVNVPKNVSPKESPGPSKTMKTLTPGGKITGIRQPITPTMKSNPTMNTAADYLSQPQLISAHALLTQQMIEMHWLKTQRQYDMFKSMTNTAHQAHNDFNNKDKQ